MKGKFLTLGLAGMAIVSCSNHDFDLEQYAAEKHEAKIQQYTQAFINTFGTPAVGHDWGFGVSTRAANTWTDSHSCNWESKLVFKSEAEVIADGAIDATQQNFDTNGTLYYIPSSFKGNLNLSISLGDKEYSIYNYGTIESISGFNGNNGILTFYNAGTLKNFSLNGKRHTFVNTGTLEVWDYANIGDLYNGGTLVLKAGQYSWNGQADIPNAMSIYSNGTATVEMPDGGDFKAAADIHGTLTVTGDAKIQNSETQYICGVKVSGTLDMTQGHLQSSNIEANEITFDGSEIWLLPGGHIKADVIRMPNSATAIYGESGSTGLIEVGDIYFQNTNNFDDSFSANIYFQITGAIDFSNSTVYGGQGKHYNNAAEYVADKGDLNSHMNAGSASGNPECGQPWTVGTPDEEDEDNESEEPTDNTLFQIWCEDLGADYTDGSNDFDFNDVVISFKKNESGNTEMWLDAAGATLPIEIWWDGTLLGEVHALFGVNTTTMVNTGSGATAEAHLLTTIMNEVTPEMAKQYLKIKVQEGETGVWYELGNTGTAPQLIVCEPGMTWSRERVLISDTFEYFDSWVHNGAGAKFANRQF